MGDSIITFFLENLTHLLNQKVNLLLGVEDEVRSLHSELLLINVFLRNFEGRRGKEQELLEELVKQIRDKAHRAEDVIDTYVVNISQQQGETIFARWKQTVSQLITSNRVAKEIQRVKKEIQEIYRNKDNLGIQILQDGEPPPTEDTSIRRRRRHIAEEADVIGLDDEARTIIKQLNGDEPELLVVTIIGMGGLGKSTLAKKVYNLMILEKHFDFCAWIYVSQDYNFRDLLQAIIRRAMIFTDDMANMSDEDLSLILRKHLGRAKYLIVLDDVWTRTCWDELNAIFANNLKGSRIILTTRNKEVALYVKPSRDHNYLRLRNASESWELLSRKVFRGETCPLELEALGKEIAERCRGLPLAIVVLAGILTKKENKIRWWPKVLSRVSSFIAEDTQHRCMDILGLSYDCLPSHLRWCFLYFGLLPEDFEIQTRQLIQLWIAERFVQEKDGETVEEIAEEYLEELIDRNLIQTAKVRFDGSIKACHIHDLLRNLCIIKAKKEKFLEICRETSPSPSSNSRRLGVHSSTIKYIDSSPSTSYVRSFLCFGLHEGKISRMHWKSLYKKFKLLRVLDLWGVAVECVPTEIERLIHLRYLRLKSHTAKTFPSSICKLWNLQTLEVKAPGIEKPQIAIWKMQQLRHLYFHGQVVLPDPPVTRTGHHENTLLNLQSLLSISPVSCTEKILSKFPNLVKLGIYGDLEKHMRLMLNNVSILNKLQKLELERDRRSQAVGCLPDCFVISRNVTKLTLSEIQLSVNPMEMLGLAPNLQVLKLKNDAYAGDVLYCSQGQFPRLKVLKLVNLGIKKWEVDLGSMPNLMSVSIRRCGSLENLPSAMKCMSSLQELELWSPNASVLNDAKDIQKHKGKDLLKLTISHSAMR